MKNQIKTLFITLITTLLCFNVLYSQKKEDKPTEKTTKDSLKNKSKISYQKLQKEGQKKVGLFNLYKIKSDFYFEINDSIFEKDLLVVNKVSKVPQIINEQGLNKGMVFDKKLIRFYKDLDAKKVWVKTINPKVQSPKNDVITQSVSDNFTPSIIEGFNIESKNTDSTSVVIKVNKVFNGKSTSFFDLFAKIGIGGSTKTNLSKIENIKTFPKNIIAKSLLTTIKKEKSVVLPITIGVTTNIVLLPKDVMKPRFSDHRIGYFSSPMDYYNDTQHEVEHRELITRWRLEPKKEDIEKYKKGELVVPKKQIVYYLDPATPKQWIPYIKQGVLDWNVAFEKAGFKNAVVVKQPKNDPDFDIDDVRYSVIVYTASPKQNAMGPSVVDPRSGEILEADIIWWHNLMKSLHRWLRTQTGTVDKNSTKNKFSDEHMGESIRFVSSHEVGHTFGLKHNMGASFSYPVDSLRSPTFTKKMGIAPSIMDYARYNYVAQPEDDVTDLNLKIGVYDKYAINWGYRWMDSKDAHQDISALNAIIRKHENDPLYFYGEQQRKIVDPRSQTEDVGDNAIKASEYGLLNLKRIVPNIINWSAETGKSYYKSSKLYKSVINQWQLYNEHVMANIGGVYLNNTVYGDNKKTYVPVPAEIQKQALDYLIDNAISYQEWLFKPEFINTVFAGKDAPDGTHYYSPIYMIRYYQASLLYNLLDTDRLIRVTENELLNEGENDIFTQEYLFNKLYQKIFEKTIKGESLTLIERMIQKNYIDVLTISRNRLLKKTLKKATHNHEQHDLRNVYFSSIKRVSDASSKKDAQLRKIEYLLNKKKQKGNQATKEHYIDLISRIKYNLNQYK